MPYYMWVPNEIIEEKNQCINETRNICLLKGNDKKCICIPVSSWDAKSCPVFEPVRRRKWNENLVNTKESQHRLNSPICVLGLHMIIQWLNPSVDQAYFPWILHQFCDIEVESIALVQIFYFGLICKEKIP